jgi:hypothetical protein
MVADSLVFEPSICTGSSNRIFSSLPGSTRPCRYSQSFSIGKDIPEDGDVICSSEAMVCRSEFILVGFEGDCQCRKSTFLGIRLLLEAPPKSEGGLTAELSKILRYDSTRRLWSAACTHGFLVSRFELANLPDWGTAAGPLFILQDLQDAT